MNGQLVLFVEDEIRQLELMRKSLEKAGYRVLVAMDGVEAVETFLRHKDEISVVVLDLGLPKLNGWEALQKMRKADPTLKPILASGYISHEMECRYGRREAECFADETLRAQRNPRKDIAGCPEDGKLLHCRR